MTTCIPLASGGFRVFVKGAAEIVLDSCTRREDREGNIIELTEAEKVCRLGRGDWGEKGGCVS